MKSSTVEGWKSFKQQSYIRVLTIGSVSWSSFTGCCLIMLPFGLPLKPNFLAKKILVVASNERHCKTSNKCQKCLNRCFQSLLCTYPSTYFIFKEFSSPPSPNNLTSSMKFQPSYYWSFTVFKNLEYNTLYLACSNKGSALLVHMDITNYPDPRALFITNEYNLI